MTSIPSSTDNMEWEVLESGCLAPADIMAKDQYLLETVQRPLLHLYEWQGDCLTYGYFTKPGDHLNLDVVQKYNLQMARRPTGGGIIFHLTDLAFSVVIPASHAAYSVNILDNYAFINEKVALAIRSFSGIKPVLLPHATDSHPFCMAQPTRYDLVINQKKVGGAAQRRTKAGFLHQGSISLAMPPKDLLKAVLKNDVFSAMQCHSYSLLEGNWTSNQLAEARQELKNALKVNICAK